MLTCSVLIIIKSKIFLLEISYLCLSEIYLSENSCTSLYDLFLKCGYVKATICII